MDTKQEVQQFLTSRRAKLTPDQVGLHDYGARRVPGLRREEVAVLAGVSVPYYTRLERGDLRGVSENILSAVAGALQLGEAERGHLFDLARAAQPAYEPPRRRARKKPVGPDIQNVLDAMTEAAALVRNRHMDIVATNALGRALYAPLFECIRQPNSARFVFLNPRSRDFYLNWAGVAHDVVAALHAEAGRDPYDRCLTDLVGELATQSEEFRILWAAHEVRYHTTALKHIYHPVVGEMKLIFNRFEIGGEPGLTMFTYTAEPRSSNAANLKLLGSWLADNRDVVGGEQHIQQQKPVTTIDTRSEAADEAIAGEIVVSTVLPIADKTAAAE